MAVRTDAAARAAARAAADGPSAWGRAADGAAGRALRAAVTGAALAFLVWLVLEQLALEGLPGGIRTALAIVAVALGAVLGLAGRTGLLLGAATAVAALWALVGLTPIATVPAGVYLVRDDGDRSSGAMPPVDAVAVLSSAMTGGGRIAGQGPERMLHALAWARQTGRPLVVTVIHDRADPSVSTLADQRQLAALAGIPEPIALDQVATTRDEAVRLAAFARRVGWRRVVVVTSPLHSRRACATVERAGLAVFCAPSPSRQFELFANGGPRTARERVRIFGYALYEAAATLEYRIRGWI